MNLKRVVGGPLLSVLFLAIFTYAFFTSQQFFTSSLKVNSGTEPADNLVNAQNIVPLEENTDRIDNVLQLPQTNKPIAVAPADTNVNSRSAISVETNLQGESKILFEKNSDVVLPIASITKLMTAIIVLDNYNLSDTWQVDKIADSQSPMKPDVKLNDTMTVNSFLEIMLIESSNKSAYTLSELVGTDKFIELMNKKAKEMGLRNTFFVDPSGLSSGNVSTAKDLAKLAEYILINYPKIGEITREKNIYIIGFGYVTNTDELLGEIPEIVCSKTGFTTQAKGCLLLAINNLKNKDYFINVVLGADNRFLEMKKLINKSAAVCN